MKFRELPLLCIAVSVFHLINGKLKFSSQFIGKEVVFEDDKYTVFRHVTERSNKTAEDSCSFLVSFKFSHLSHRMNQLTSIIPMLIITGFPGFISKMYAANKESGYWLGLYEWQSKTHLENYTRSFVFRMMKKRAVSNTLKMKEFENRDQINIEESLI